MAILYTDDGKREGGGGELSGAGKVRPQPNDPGLDPPVRNQWCRAAGRPTGPTSRSLSRRLCLVAGG